MEHKRKLVVKIKRPNQVPVKTKAQKKAERYAWLEAENRKYYNFPLHRDIGEAFCQLAISMGQKPTERVEELIRADLEVHKPS